MKKNKFLIISIIILLLSFLNYWYRDFLFNKLFVFALIPNLISFAAYIVCFIYTIKSILKERCLTNIMTIIILCIIPIMIFIFPFRITKVKFDFDIYEKQRIEIINMIKERKMIPDELGNAELPKKFKKLSNSNEIHVYQNDEDGVVIGFWIFRGMMSGSTELIYSSKDEKLIKENETGHSITNIIKIRNHWYYVETEY